ncbi:hypothetical protein EKO29_12320 [Colwellia sp. Arc7-635]|uniref:hypothetical protein n=1 Tax=Colwellia sp. Arc7-635 TaxID=2497879 RepID=UPI000F850CEB|nr:hypothetical protein [Colwellia sp. Arc7-635]AZQ84712.1 hypothetical protein EKO29_12320 [Colwellia sp. Arc7-635]
MNNFRTKKKGLLSSVIVLTTALQACGGSSDSSSSNEIGYTPIVTETGIIAFDDATKTAQPVDLFLYYPDDTLSNINWEQTAGDDVVFHANRSKGIAFTPPASGEYDFQVSFNRNGVSETLTHTVVVSDESSQISARLGQATLEGSNVSLSAHIENSAITSDSIQWQQVSGPSVTFSEATSGKSAVFFTAPAVSADSLLEFTLSASDGSTRHQDSVAILIENAPDIASNDNIAYNTRLATVFPFNANSPYADVITQCVYSNSIDFRKTCRFNELPLIAQDSVSPTVNDIMNHVVVSHQWMGERFKEFLENNDPHDDFKNLLRATTAIVISSDVRPSYYWSVTGAIHLDPSDLWLTPEERDTISQLPDYRASFGDALNFVMPWRYVINNSYASFSYPSNMRITRDPADAVYTFAALMYHELAHANDYFPQSEWASINKNDRVLDNANQRREDGIPSDKLSIALPLHGDEMYRLAQVRFQGETATETEKSYSPSDVTGFFSPEHSPHFYNYSSKREDYAMLFDAIMMKARYNVDRDIAVTSKASTSAEYVVTWGQRGRIGDENIKPRVDYVTSRILPEFTEASDIIDNLVTPIAMQPGRTWAENLAITPTINKINNVTDKVDTFSSDSFLLDNVRYQKINVNGQMFFEKPLPPSKQKKLFYLDF